MNKGLLGFFLTFIALLVGALYYTNIIQSPFISVLNSIKINYHDATEFVQTTIHKHFFQAKHITELEEKLQKYENNHLVMQQLASEINDLFTENQSKLKINPKVELVRTISYQKFGNQNRVWLEVNDYNASKIYGLTYKELVAGIVISENNRAVGLLNRDIKSSYAVYVGADNAPGIAHGNSAKNLIIKFIPAWFTLKVGDEVVTSGLDNIFFKGLKVGTVLSITKSQGYQKPQNFLSLGLIALLFPNARIIHIKRNPLDTCLSCYFQNFSSAHAFSFDLKQLGIYYRKYEKLMSYWRQLGIPFLDVQYENPEKNP